LVSRSGPVGGLVAARVGCVGVGVTCFGVGVGVGLMTVAVGTDWDVLSPSEQPAKSRPETITATKSLMKPRLDRAPLCVSELAGTGQIADHTTAAQ
jgi:hypothetical protein